MFLVAASIYPGGSQSYPDVKGFDWSQNYLSDLFAPAAVNGAANPSRYAAIPGMLALCLALAFLFRDFADKQPSVAMRRLISLPGVAAMGFAFLAVTPYHDAMITVASSLSLLSLSSITVALYKSKRYPSAIFGVLCLLLSYFTNYVYFARQLLELLPTLQKLGLLLLPAWLLSLAYLPDAPAMHDARDDRGAKPDGDSARS